MQLSKLSKEYIQITLTGFSQNQIKYKNKPIMIYDRGFLAWTLDFDCKIYALYAT